MANVVNSLPLTVKLGWGAKPHAGMGSPFDACLNSLGYGNFLWSQKEIVKWLWNCQARLLAIVSLALHNDYALGHLPHLELWPKLNDPPPTRSGWIHSMAFGWFSPVLLLLFFWSSSLARNKPWALLVEHVYSVWLYIAWASWVNHLRNRY